MVHILLKHGLENFEHYCASVWDEWEQLCSSLNILWHCLSLGLEWKLTFPVLWPLLSFPNLLAYWVQHFHSIIFRIWNSSTGMPSPPLALFVVMLPKAHLTLHSRMSGSRWVITPSWLPGSWRSFLYSPREELLHAQGQGGRPERSYPSSKGRWMHCAQEGREELLHIHGQEGRLWGGTPHPR